ncbi:hypothetical protein F4677DRAFT_393824 [Hypoxylon crocopeplum]|nr:hypothetical protein F4677DRAFT_393824 [Hypoxylon crocopeplum]
MMVSIRLWALMVASSLAISSATSPEGFGPTLDSARENGPQIFNGLHDAMREFGSALHHNGMSLFPAVIPEGVLLYHGTHTAEVPKSYEWLAFEIEHAEGFSRSRVKRPNSTDGDQFLHPLILANDISQKEPPRLPPPWDQPGHLHIYQAERPLNVLYIDGTAAGKTDMGTCDTQDILLTGNKSRVAFDDWGRARDLCTLGQEWKVDGFIRMEPGFEVIYCDFTDGLRLLSTYQVPFVDEPGYMENLSIVVFEWARAAAQRYNGIGSSRVILDYSSLFSAFFYPINFTNPDPERPELPRLTAATSEEIDIMREDVAALVARSKSQEREPINWQGVTDMIVTRYATRLPLIAQADSMGVAKSEINTLLNIYIDYAEKDDGFAAAQQRCAEFYLRPVRTHTPEDKLLYAAIESTAATICTTLFKARQLIVEESDTDEPTALRSAQKLVSDLIEMLRWSDWKECGRCQPNELCMVAMWPMGNVEDHYNPSCVNYSAVIGRNNYWWGAGRVPGHKPPPLSFACADREACREHDDLGNEEL